MPTLSAMFRIMDGYSSQVNKFIGKTNEAATKVLTASRNTDTFNDKLVNTGVAANVASAGLTKLIGAVASLAAVKKVMDLTDTYVNTSARVSMVNDQLQDQAELQNKIFAAANRARGSYVDMASAVSKMNLLAKESFGTNDEAIQFTELLQKSLKVSGAGQGEQDSAFLQLTQAMASGKLQGDEFRSVMENAPMVANAIAKYLGVTKGELKELSSDGAITADIIKNAMFEAADDINNKFDDMPMTFADIWNRIKNTGMQAFGGVFTKINELVNSDSFQNTFNAFIGTIYLASDAMGAFIDFCVAAWPMVSPFIWAAVAALGAYAAVQVIANGIALISTLRFGAQAIGAGLHALAMWATSKATWAAVTAELSLNSALYACPLVWILGIVLVLIAAFYAIVAAINHFAGTSYSATGMVFGAFSVLGAFLWNMFLSVLELVIGVVQFMVNPWLTFANFLANVFTNPISSIIYLFQGLADAVLGILEKIAAAIDSVFGSNLAGAVSGWRSGLKDMADAAVAKYAPDESYKEVFSTLDFGTSDFGLSRQTYSGAWDKGYETGANLGDNISDFFSGFAGDNSFGTGTDGYGAASNPAMVKGKGKGGAVDVDMSDEDIQYLRDIAQRDYVAKISTNTLAPNIAINFTGPITKEADAEAIKGTVEQIMRDEIANSAEGKY